MSFGLSENNIEKIKSVLKGSPFIEKAIIFGSRAKGNYKEGSDIDLAIKGNISFSDFLITSVKLEELNLPYKIDLVDYNAIKDTAVIEHINRAGIIFYKKQ